MPASNRTVPVLAELKSLLAPLGYRKTAALFSLDRGDVVHLIQLQSSQGSTAAQALVTVNLGVFVPSLVYADVRDQTKPSIAGAHWRQRLGIVMPEKRDKWWSIDETMEAKARTSEIVSNVAGVGLNALAEVPSLEALRRIWESGVCPGLTDVERQCYLRQLAESAPR
jgi:hypothetical protein